MDAEALRNHLIWDLDISHLFGLYRLAKTADLLFDVVIVGIYPGKSLFLI
jgi:hypothetical protein